MSGAIVVRKHGPPDVLQWEEVELGDPGSGEVLLRQTAAGLNYIDTYQRTGVYPLDLPFTPGAEGAGVVEAVGAGVTDLSPGDRVAYTGNVPPGAYAEMRVLPADRLVRLPDGIDDVTAAGVMLKGCTVEYLIHRAFQVLPGHWVLLHAAAGGVGLIACQWLKAIGANVIGTAGSEAKAYLAKQHGCDHVILYREEDVASRVRDVTGGQGVDVVYDGVGKDTFEGSMDSLRTRGMLVSFGNASGPVAPVAPLLLGQKGGLFLTRPSLKHYYTDVADARAGCAAVLNAVASGIVNVVVNHTYPLREVQQAHRELEARNTTGSTVLLIE